MHSEVLLPGPKGLMSPYPTTNSHEAMIHGEEMLPGPPDPPGLTGSVDVFLWGLPNLQWKMDHLSISTGKWIDLREHLQETIDFPVKYGAFLYVFP